MPIIASAPAEPAARGAWLERLWQAHAADEIPYIETLAAYWGALCVSKETASGWADCLLESSRQALSPDREVGDFFHGTSACLSALYAAERYAEIVDLLDVPTLWAYRPPRTRGSSIGRSSSRSARRATRRR